MSQNDVDLSQLYRNERFPRANGYDPWWIADNQMGPNVLWLAEWLSERMALERGMRVLDLGCGRAISSIFLAQEFKVTVFATDLWIAATDNWARIKAAGLQDQVFPCHAEAHALPFAENFFDAIVALDSYAYFGTDDLYLSYIIRMLRPGGQIGIVVPGLMKDLDVAPPEHLTRPQSNGKAFWEPDCWTFHTAAWWQRHWSRAGTVDVAVADEMPDGWRIWLQHERAMEAAGTSAFPSDAEALEADGGEYVGFVRLVAQRRAAPTQTEQRPASAALGSPHVWEPAFMAVCAELLQARKTQR